MIITCSECESSFEVDDSLIKETGSKVRCSKCISIFVAYRQSSDAEIAEVSDEPQLGMDDQLESDSELAEDELDWDMEEDADDGLPDLETKTVEFGLDLDLEEEDDDSEAAEMVADMTEEPELDLSLDEEDDETDDLGDIFGGAGTLPSLEAEPAAAPQAALPEPAVKPD